MNVSDLIKDDWAHDPSVMSACLRVWQVLSARDSHLDHYTFNDLQEVAEEEDRSIVSKVLLYLSNPRLKVLRTCLMYEFNGGYFELPAEEVAHYAKGEGIVHPEYGESLPESEILVCFTPGACLQSKDSL